MKVLIGMDGSEPAQAALKAFSQTSLAASCEVVLATVAPPLPIYAFAENDVLPDAPEIERTQMQADQQRLDSLRDEFQSRFASCQTQVRRGSPSRELLRLGREFNVDLTLLGAVGHSALSRMLLGSTSDEVANHAATACLVHRQRSDRNSESDENQVTPLLDRVLIAISNHPDEGPLPTWATRLELAPGTEVHLLHVMETRPEYDLDLLKRVASYMKEVRSAAWKLMDDVRPELEERQLAVIPAMLEAAHVGQAIVDYANQHHCSLIVVGDHEEALLERILLGSVSRYVVRHADVSVLVAHSPATE
ncbi:MAG: universal stress protein [Planctomycetota bacterium]